MLKFRAVGFAVILLWVSCLADYAGIYTGTFSGGDTGTWRMYVDSSGIISGFIYSDTGGEHDLSMGSVDLSGRLSAESWSAGAEFSGTISQSGSVSGNWTNLDYEISGRFTGQRVYFAGDSATVNNRYFPVRIGQQWNYQGIGVTAGRSGSIRATSSETVDGVLCVKTESTVDEVAEWFAQDSSGNVWRLKESNDHDDYLEMPASPVVGQEYFLWILRYKVISTSDSVTTPAGTFTGCLKLECVDDAWSGNQYDYYAPGVGLVKTVDDSGGWELTSYSGAVVGNDRYIVTFDAQGGSVSPTSATVTNGLNYGTLPTPIRSGYTFGGWWTGAGGSGTQVTSSTTVTVVENQTLYAKWIPITYQLTVNGGSGGGSYTNQQRVAITASVPLGKRFYRWLGDTQYVDSVTSADTFVTMPPFAITLTATNGPIAMPWLNLLLE